MKKYKGYIIPANMTKEFILGELAKGPCGLGTDKYCEYRSCIKCVHSIHSPNKKLLIGYAIEEKYITKGEALSLFLEMRKKSLPPVEQVD